MVKGLKLHKNQQADRSLIETQQFWNTHPCEGEFDTHAHRLRYRYLKGPYIPALITAHIPKGGRVLEVGCGQGADLCLLAKRSTRAVGIDLTPEAVRRTKDVLKQQNVKNAMVLVGNGEALPIANQTFDAVYSFGVMHHSPNTQACIDEAYRILKPGGTALIMLYRSRSPQYIMVKMLRTLTYPFRSHLANHFSTKKFHNSNFWGTSLAELFGAPILKGYSHRQLKEMFSSFSRVSVLRYNTGLDRLRLWFSGSKQTLALIDGFEEATRDTLGFFNVIIAKK